MVASNTAAWMYRTGQAWLVLALWADPMLLGFVTALQFLPLLVVGPWAGALAERVDRRRLLLVTHSALTVQALVLAVLVLLGLTTPAILLVAAASLGVISALDAPARAAIVPDLVPTTSVTNAVALNSASLNLARLVGPAAAGLIIAVANDGVVFLASAAAFAAMGLVLTRLHTEQQITAGSRSGGVRGGLHHVRTHPDLLFVILLTGSVSLVALNFQLTVPLMASVTFAAGPELFGVLASVMAVGSLAGALIAARRGNATLRRVTIAALALGAGSIAAGLAPGPWTFGLALLACGFSALTMMTGANSYLQLHAGADHRSRVMALYLSLLFGSTLFGAPAVGAISATWGPRWALIGSGLAALAIAGLLPWAFRGRLVQPARGEASSSRDQRQESTAPQPEAAS